MNPKAQEYWDKNYSKMNAEWKQYIKKEHLKNFYGTMGSVNEVLTNTASYEFDMRDPNDMNKVLLANENLSVISDPEISSVLMAETVTEFQKQKSEIRGATGTRKALGEFLLACQEVLGNKVIELNAETAVIDYFTISQDAIHDRVSIDIPSDVKKQMRDYGGGDLPAIREAARIVHSSLINIGLQVVYGDERDVLSIQRPRNQGESEITYVDALYAQAKNEQNKHKENMPVVAFPDIYDYNGLFAEISSKPEFKQFRDMTFEKLVDPSYLKMMTDGGGREWPETAEYQVKRSAYIDQEEFLYSKEESGKSAEKLLCDYYSSKINDLAATHNMKTMTPYDLSSFFYNQSQNETITKAADQAIMIKEIENLNFGRQWYNLNIGATIGKKNEALLKEGGKSFADIIFIGGKSVQELYGERYRDMPYYLRKQAMESQVTAAVLKAELPITVAAFKLGDDKQIEIDMSHTTVVLRNVEPFQKTEAERVAYRNKQKFVNEKSIFEKAYNHTLFSITGDNAKKYMIGEHSEADMNRIFGNDINVDASTLETIMTMQVKKDHPEYHLVDIINPEKSANQTQIENLKQEVGARLMEQMATREGLETVLGSCNELFTQLELGSEAEYAAGIPQNLSGSEKEDLYKDAKHHGAMSAFYVSTRKMMQGYEQLVGEIEHTREPAINQAASNPEQQLQNNRSVLEMRQRLKLSEMTERRQYRNALAITKQVGEASAETAQFIIDGAIDAVSDGVTAAFAKLSIMKEKLMGGQPAGKVWLPFTEDEMYEGTNQLISEMSPENRQQMVLTNRTPDVLKAKLAYNLDPAPKIPLYDIEKFNPDAILSEGVLIKLREADRRQSIGSAVVRDYLKNHKAIGDGSNIDTRDLYNLIDTTGLSDDEIKEKTDNMVEDYYDTEHPEKRKTILDDFYDRVDFLDVRTLDLSVLTTNPPTDPIQREKSESDVVKLIWRVDCDQGVTVKLKENPEYEKERYADPIKKAHFDNQSDLMMAYDSYIINTVFDNGGYDRRGISGEPNNSHRMVARKDYTTNVITAMKVYGDRESCMSGGTPDGILPFVAPDSLGNLLGIEKAGRPLDRKWIINGSIELQTRFDIPFFAQSEKKDMNLCGINQLSETFFIDGKSAEEVYGNQYKNLSEKQHEAAICAEIMSAIVSGEHHVDMAMLTPTAEGSVDIQMYAIKADLSCLDAKQKEVGHWYQTLNSKKAEKTWNNDKGRDARMEAEKTVLAEKMMVVFEKNMIAKEKAALLNSTAAPTVAPKAVPTVAPEAEPRREIEFKELCKEVAVKTMAPTRENEHVPEKGINK